MATITKRTSKKGVTTFPVVELAVVAIDRPAAQNWITRPISQPTARSQATAGVVHMSRAHSQSLPTGGVEGEQKRFIRAEWDGLFRAMTSH